MGLSLVEENIADDFGLAHEALEMIQPQSAYRTPQGTRGAAPHAPAYDRALPPRPAAAFPTQEVIAVLAAIGAVLAARLALLVALGMMFALGMAGGRDGVLRMSLFGVFGVVPIVILAGRRNI